MFGFHIHPPTYKFLAKYEYIQRGSEYLVENFNLLLLGAIPMNCKNDFSPKNSDGIWLFLIQFSKSQIIKKQDFSKFYGISVYWKIITQPIIISIIVDKIDSSI